MSSKNKVKSSGEIVGWGYGYVVSENVPNTIIGKVLTLLEAVGLPLQQENALKGLITQAVWDSWSYAIFITPERHNSIREEVEKKKKEIGDSVPMSAV